MSRASMAVRFADGTIRYGLYNGTSDVIWPRLFDTINEAWEAHKAGADFYPDEEPAEDDSEPVTIFEDYGWGAEFPGRATREYVVFPLDRGSDEFYEQIVEPGLERRYANYATNDARPDWVTWR